MRDLVGWLILGAMASAYYFAKRTRHSFEIARNELLALPSAVGKVSSLRSDRLGFLFTAALAGACIGAIIWAALEILVWLLNH